MNEIVQTIWIQFPDKDVKLLGKRKTIILTNEEETEGIIKNDGRRVFLIGDKWIYFVY